MKKDYRNYTAAPYVRTRMNTGDLMFLTVLALLPCAGVGLYHYGLHAALLVGISVGTAIAAELLCDLTISRKRASSVWDYSCVVTGLICGLILPPSAPLSFAAAEAALAVVVFKHCFGGLGRNLFNPAMAAKCVLLAAAWETMNDFGTSTYTDPSPLVLLESGQTPDLMNMVTGNTAGCIGTASAAAVLVSAAILLLAGVIDLAVPAGAIIGFMLTYFALGEYGTSLYVQCVQLCGGSFLFTAFIMAGDSTTSPLSRQARAVYGLLLGALTCLLRELGGGENASAAALLAVNALRPLLDKFMAPRPFGSEAMRWVVRERRRPAQSGAQTAKSGDEAAQPGAAPAGAEAEETLRAGRRAENAVRTRQPEGGKDAAQAEDVTRTGQPEGKEASARARQSADEPAGAVSAAQLQKAARKGKTVTNEMLDEEFERFEEQIALQTRGLEAARYTGDDTLLREAQKGWEKLTEGED